MKDDWLTIPDFDHYEINRKLQVRHKKTKRLLKQQVSAKKCSCVVLHVGNKSTTRSVEVLLSQAVAARNTGKWYPVPSLNNQYEFSPRNQLRNAKTKRIKTRASGTRWMVSINGKSVWVSIASLRLEIFGENLPFGINARKQVIIRKGNTTLHFASRAAAARHIAVQEHYSAGFLAKLFAQRRAYIKGWDINYLEDDCMGIVGEYTKNISCCPKEDKQNENN